MAAPYTISGLISLDGVPGVVAKLADVAKAGDKAGAAISKTATAAQVLAAAARKAMGDLTNLAGSLNKSVSQLAAYSKAQLGATAATDKALAGLRELQAGHAKAAESARLNGEQIKSLFGILGKAGGGLVSGDSPLKILIEQGADLAGLMKSSGLGFKAFAAEVGTALGVLPSVPGAIAPITVALGELGSMLTAGGVALAPLAPALVGVGVVAAGAFGAAALAARALNQENGDLTKGMGLTEEQLKSLKDQGVDTGVTIGDVFQGTFNAIAQAVGPVLEPVRNFFSDLFNGIATGFSHLLDDITTGLVAVIKGLVGGFAGAFAAIKATWNMLPEAIGDLTISAANFALKALNDLVNQAIDLVNPLIDKANAAGKVLGLPFELGRLSPVDFGQIKNPHAGAAAATAAAGQKAFEDAYRQATSGIDKVFKDLGVAIVAAARERISKSVAPAETAKKTGGADAAKDHSEAASKSCTCPTPTVTAAATATVTATAAATAAATARAVVDEHLQQAQVLEKAQPPNLEGFKSTEQIQKEVNDTFHVAAKSVGETFKEAANAVSSFKDAIKQQDWSAAFSSLQQTFVTIRDAFRAGPVSGLTSLAGAAGSLIGGKTGKGVAGGASIAIGGLMGANLLADTAFALGPAALGGTGLLGAGMVNMLAGVAGVLGPMALAAGALYAVAKIAGIGGKPSNHAAIAQITGDSYSMISTGKETAETTQSAGAAADAIVKTQAAFTAAGLTLSKTVQKIDLGTRDLTHIFLSSGEELRSAKGDANAAVDTALRAVLQGATYVSDAQKKLVESALAAGEGFDKIAEKLQAFASAQLLSGQLDREILKFTDPPASAVKELGDAQKTRRDAAKATADAGYLTAEQLAGVNAQLDQLDQLELASTLKPFKDAVEQSTKALMAQRQGLEADLLDAQGNTVQATAARRQVQLGDMAPELRGLQAQVWAVQDAREAEAKATADVETKRNNLSQSYEREASAIEATRDRFRDFAKALQESRDAMALEGLSRPATAAVLRARLQSTAVAARNNDEAAMGALPGLGGEYLAAAKGTARSAAEYAREVSFVRATLEDTQRYAETQASAAEQQLDLLKAQVSGILQVDASVNGVAGALGAYQQAVAALAAAKAAVTVAEAPIAPPAATTAIVNGQLTVAQATRYLAMNPDLGNNWNANGIMRQLGPDLVTAAQVHYQRTGQFEIAQGLRHALSFATGGSFEVGGRAGQDQNFVPLWLTRGEVVNVRRPGTANDNSEVVGAIGKLEGRLVDMTDALVAANSRLAVLEKLNRKWDGEGLPETRTA